LFCKALKKLLVNLDFSTTRESEVRVSPVAVFGNPDVELAIAADRVEIFNFGAKVVDPDPEVGEVVFADFKAEADDDLGDEALWGVEGFAGDVAFLPKFCQEGLESGDYFLWFAVATGVDDRGVAFNKDVTRDSHKTG
jgi:hypothetical protein